MNRFGRFFDRVRRSFGNQQWIQDWIRGKDSGGMDSYAGVNISPESAIRNSAVFNAGWILSNTIAALPLFVYKRVTDGKEKAVDHSLYDLLHIQPNELMSSFIYREMMMWHLLFWGNSYSNIVIDNKGKVTALWPMLPWRMTPEWRYGKMYYKYRLPDNTETILSSEEVLHIPGMSFDGLEGKSVLSCAREGVGLGLALEEFGARFFGQGTQFGGIVEAERTLGPKAEANLRAALKEKYQGISNAHRLLILEDGMKYKQNIIPPNDAQFLESRKFEITEIARFFNIPPHLLKDLDRATFNNIEHMGIEFVTYSLLPWLTRIEQSETIKLLSKPERKVYFIEHLVDGLLRGDLKTRYEAYNIARLGGWMNADEIRALENMNPLPDGQGQSFWMPLNYMDAKKAAEIPVPKEIPDEQASKEIRTIRSAALKGRLANNYRKLFEDTISKIIKFERNGIVKATKSMFGKRKASIKTFNEFLEQFYKEKYDEINKRTKPVVDTYGKVVFDAAANEVKYTDSGGAELDSYMDEYTEAFNLRYIATSKNRLSDAVDGAITEGTDPIVAVENKFDEFEKTRPQTVSLKEVIKIAGAVSILAYGLAGIGKTVWVAAGPEPCDFCLGLSGKTMSLGQPYKSKNDVYKVKGKEPLSFSSNIAHPPLHGGCACQIMPG